MKPDVTVYVRRKLFSEERSVHYASSRQSLTEIIESFCPDLAEEVPHLISISVNESQPIPSIVEYGTPYAWSPWDQIRPKPGSRVFIRLKEPGNVQGMGAGLTAIGIVTAFFVPILGISIALAGATILATSFLTPEVPSSQGGRDSYTLTGVRNELAQVGQIIPYVAGRWRKVFPLHVAQPYATWEKGKQYLHALLSPGHGPLRILNPKIGDVAFADFAGLEYEIREGRPTDSPVTLYPRVVHEALAEPNGQPVLVTFVGGPVTVAIPDPDVTRLTFELLWPDLFRRGEDSGKTHPAHCEVKIEYRPLPSGAWTTLTQETISDETFSPKRLTWGVNVTANAAGWEGRVTRISEDVSEAHAYRFHNLFYWTSFRGNTKDTPVHVPGQALIAIKVAASQNAQGVLDQISCDCTRYALDWDGSTWAEAPSANPATVFRSIPQHVVANRGEVYSDSRIDLAGLQTWHEHNTATGRTFGLVFSDEGTMLDRLRAVASAGRASFDVVDAKIGVVEDLERTEYAGAITPHNSNGFVKRQSFKRLPHAVRVGFYDHTNDSTRQELTVYADGYNQSTAEIFDDLDLTSRGITLPLRAREEGRIYLAEQLYRRWIASQEMDLEALSARRGELISFSHPAALLGINDGRIKSTMVVGSDTTAVTVEGFVFMEAGKSYATRIRTVESDGTPQVIEVELTTVAGRQTVLTFATPVPLSMASIAAGDLYQFGESSLVAVDCIVKAIEPSGPRTASVSVIPHAQPQINNSISGPMDPYDPHITVPQGQPKAPPTPVIVSIKRGDVIIPPDPGSVRMVQLTILISVPPAKTTPASFFDARFQIQGTEDWFPSSASSSGLEISFLVPWGSIYNIQVRSGTSSQGIPIASDWSTTVVVDCKTVPRTIVDVASVTGLELAGQGNDTNFVGRDAHLVWRMTGWLGVEDIGDEEGGGDQTFLDPTFSHWKVSVFTGDTLQQRREEIVTQPEYYYSYDKNYMDAALLSPLDPILALARQFKIVVSVVDTYGRESPVPARLIVQNPAPALPTGLSVSTNIGTVWVSFNFPNDPDWIGMKVWASTISGFVPDDNVNLLSKRNANEASFNTFKDGSPILQGTQYFVRIALFDAFGDDISLLNVSSEFTVTTQTIDLTDLPEYTFDPAPDFTVSVGGGVGGVDRLNWSSSTVHVTHPASGTSNTYSIGSGFVDYAGQTLYISYQDMATILETNTDPAYHTSLDRTLMARWRGGQQVTAFNGQAGIDGNFLYAGTVTANALATGELITESAQIRAAIINDGHIQNLSADKILSDSVFTQLLHVGSDVGGRIDIDGPGAIMRVMDNQVGSVQRVRLGRLGPGNANYGIEVYNAASQLVLSASGLNGTFIEDLTVGTGKLFDNAVSRSTVVTAGSLSRSGGGFAGLVSGAINSLADSRVLIWFTCETFASGAPTQVTGDIRLLRNGNTVRTRAIAAPVGRGVQTWFTFDNSPIEGTNTYNIQVSAGGGGQQIDFSVPQLSILNLLK